jgi:peptidoglycan/LPS O-acetylase OafA/YrhL
MGAWAVTGAVLFLFVVDPLLQFHFYGGFTLLVGMTLEGVSICVITLYVVKRPETVPGRILNTPVLRHIGVISYSLYLWQSIIIAEAGQFFLLALVAMLACAEFSYWVVERPSLRLRARLGESRPSVAMKN